MKNPSKKYWEDRAEGRMVGYTAKAESTADTLGKAYYATARYLQGEANDVFNAFTDKFELSIAEAETMLKNAPDKSMFEQMKTALATCTDEQKKQELETLLSSPAYAHRIGRLNDLDSKISDMCSRLANAEIGVDTEHLGDIIQSAYMQTVFDVTKGAAKRFAELGYDTVLISQYGGCSETCEPYQGKVYIDDVFTIWNGEKSGDFGKSNYCDKWFMLLSVAIRGGLFHPNCRHTMGQYIDGLTKIPQPIPAEKIREQRALEEKQRAMERKIRALKRKIEGTQDEKKVKEYKRKLREEQGKLREFIKEHDDVLRRDYSREKIYSGKGEPKQTAPRTEEAPVKATDTESKNPVPTDKEPNIPQPDNNVSEPENNENTMNFVQPEPVKTVQSNEETDDAPTAAMTDEADETAETTENVQETVKQPVEIVTDSEEDVQNFTNDTVDNSDESDIIKTGSDDVAEIIELGKLDTQPLEIEFGKLKTDELIVTNERIEHIKSRHPEDFNLFEKYGLSVVVEPDFIIKDEKNVNTVFMVKKLENTNLNLVVKIILETDEKDLKNSVMTFYRIRERNLKKLVDRNKTLYKSE